jgi:2-keto-4-pentenoate hydratase
MTDAGFVTDLLLARDSARFTQSPTRREPGFDLERAYRIGQLLHQELLDRGFEAAGRKIGFTNRATWKEFNLDTPIWAPMYTQTVHFAEQGRCRLALPGWMAPKIEPEIVLKLRTPVGSDNPAVEEIAHCLEWAALGFEIVDCHFSNWRFTAADAVADFGLHAALVVGTPWLLKAQNAREVANALETLSVVLRRGTECIAEGEGRNALGSPLAALGHLARLLKSQTLAPGLSPGEIITTGTLTTPPFISRGERWLIEADGAPLPPLSLDLV